MQVHIVYVKGQEKRAVEFARHFGISTTIEQVVEMGIHGTSHAMCAADLAFVISDNGVISVIKSRF